MRIRPETADSLRTGLADEGMSRPVEREESGMSRTGRL